jgi:hypothetical protein
LKALQVVGLGVRSPKLVPLVLSDAERASLEALSWKRAASQALAERSRVVLACDLAVGPVIAQHYRRHRHQEFLRLLKLIDSAVPKDLDLHLVLDNYAIARPPRSKSGWPGTRGSTCASPRPAARGSTWPSGGSPS